MKKYIKRDTRNFLKNENVSYTVNGTEIIVDKADVKDGRQLNRLYAYALCNGEKICVMKESTLKDRLLKEKLKKRKDLSPTVLMEELGWDYSRAYRFLKKNGYKWKRPKVEKERNIDCGEVMNLYRKGVSQSDIAKNLGCSRQYVHLVVKGKKK